MTSRLAGATCAITGGAGLIGSFLADQLVDAGAKVVIVDDFSKGARDNIAHLDGKVDVCEVDLEVMGSGREMLAGADYLFHLASRAYGVGHGAGRHGEILRHNERITDNVLDAVVALRPAHMLITSSSCVYPDDGPDTVPELPLFSGEPEAANRGYGWAKRFLEQKAVLASEEADVPLTIVRPFNIYGERYAWVGESSQAIPMLVKKVMDGNDPVIIWGSGEQRRTYLHATDCALIMRRLVELGYAEGPVNIGLEETVSVRELVETLCRLADRHPALTCDRSKPEGRFVKSSDPTRLFEAVPGFTPTVGLDDGLSRMIDWYRSTFS